VEPQRRDVRDSLFLLAQLKHEGATGGGETVRVRNVSSGGLMAQAPEDFRQGMRVEVTLDGIGAVSGTVAWAEAGRIGIAFDHPVDKALARKPRAASTTAETLFRPTAIDFRRPGLRPR
jgi:PilZ domain.